MTYKASLIISVYNNVTFLKVILDSLKQQTEKDFEIIISEDACHEEIKNLIQSYSFENDYQHLTQEDIGWRKNKALNKAVRHAKADWLIFIDGDCVLHPRFVEMHLRYANENIILVGKRVKTDKETSLFIIENMPECLNIIQKLFLKKLLWKDKNIKYIKESIFISPDSFWGFIPKIRRAHRLTGCNMSFSRKAIYAINGFDEDYILPAVGEDTDLAWRFKALGFKLKSLRNLAVQYHLYHEQIWNDKRENRIKLKADRKAKKAFCKRGLQQNGDSI